MIHKKFNSFQFSLDFLTSIFKVIVATTIFSGNSAIASPDSHVAELLSEIKDAKIIIEKLHKVADSIDDYVWIGTAYNDMDSKEHACYSLGILNGKIGSVKHLKLHRNPSFRAKDSYDAHDLRVKAQSLENFIAAAEYAIKLTPQKRFAEWNLDCVGQLKISANTTKSTEQKIFYSLENNGTVLRILGDIEDGFSLRLKNAIDKNPKITTVALGSGGGVVVEALKAGYYIRSRGLDTILWNNCFSACPLVFLGGINRTVPSPYPYLGFHQAYTSAGPAPLNSDVYKIIARYVQDMGASSKFVLSNMFSASPTEMKIIKGGSELCAYKIATNVQRTC